VIGVRAAGPLHEILVETDNSARHTGRLLIVAFADSA
jgi:hypothetical protein